MTTTTCRRRRALLFLDDKHCSSSTTSIALSRRQAWLFLCTMSSLSFTTHKMDRPVSAGRLYLSISGLPTVVITGGGGWNITQPTHRGDRRGFPFFKVDPRHRVYMVHVLRTVPGKGTQRRPVHSPLTDRWPDDGPLQRIPS